jgi:Uma2 family endonuclease
MDVSIMMIAPDKVRITQAEFNRLLTLPEYQDRNVELWDGEIVETMPKLRHAFAQGLLVRLFGSYFETNPIGHTFPELQIDLDDEHYAPVPDISIVLHAQGALDWDENLPFMPALVVEIQSPDQSDKFMREKAAWYVAHGCRMVITVFIKPIVEVLTPTDVRLLTLGDTLEGGDVLPGFRVAVEKLYPSQSS